MHLLQTNIDGSKAKHKTLLKISRKGKKLIFSFFCEDSSLLSYSNIDNDRLYDASVVEVFLDIGKENYLEIEVAPNGAKFVASILNRNITFIDSSFVKTSSLIVDNSYRATIIIDLSKLDITGDIKFNAYRIEMDKDKKQHLYALNPTFKNDFHVRDKFVALNQYLNE